MTHKTTPTIADPFAAAKDKMDRENPRTWVWDEDGEVVAGTYVGAGVGNLRDGTEVPTRTLKTAETGYRILWLFKSPKDLPRVFASLDRDGLVEGDYVMVQRYPKRQFTDEQTGERKFFVPYEGTRIAAAELGVDAPGEPASVHEPLEALEAEAATVAAEQADAEANDQAAREAEDDIPF